MPTRLQTGPGTLTERNREVLRLLERGMTNYEIATELGISLEGAKYHVREIMTRLNVESREEAVAAWHREQQPVRRIRRAVLTLFAGKTGWATVAVVAAGMGALAVVISLNLGGDDSSPASPSEPEATATATGIATATPTVLGTALPTVLSVATVEAATPTTDKDSITVVPTLTPRPLPESPLIPVTGLFEGAPTGAATSTTVVREMGTPIASAFEPLEELRMVIYDVAAGESLDLGAGWRGQFSSDGRWVGWIAAEPPAQSGIATVLQLDTGVTRTFGPGNRLNFVDNNRVAISQDAPDAVVYDVATGEQSADQEIPNPSPSASGYYWEITNDESTRFQQGGFGRSRFRLVDGASHEVVLDFDALTVAFGAPGEIVLATAVDDASINSENAETNIFIVDIATGSTEFISRIRLGARPTLPLSATGRFVLWTEAFCSYGNQGRLSLFDRETRTLMVLDDGLAPGELHYNERYGKLTPDGDIALGTFGAKAIVDGDSLEYRVVLPRSLAGGGNDVAWSPDYRYAFYEHRGGHGGLCGS